MFNELFVHDNIITNKLIFCHFKILFTECNKHNKKNI